MKKILLCLLAIFVLYGCTTVEEVTSITITGEVKVGLGNVIELSVDTTDKVVWTSEDDTIATVEEGYVYGHKLGKVIVRVALENDPSITDTHLITVVEEVTDNIGVLSIMGPDEVEIGSPISLELATTDVVTWSSSDENIAFIDEHGEVTGLNTGTVVIRVQSTTNVHRFGSMKLEVVVSSTYAYYQTKILSINQENQSMELFNVPATNYNENTEFFLYKNGLTPIAVEDLYIGLENIYVEVNKKENVITKVMVDKEIGFNNIRVAIRNSIADISIEDTLYHGTITLTPNGTTKLQTFDNETSVVISSGTAINIALVKGEIVVSTSTGTILKTSKRIIFQPGNNTITMNSITRGYGYPIYEGNLEVSIAKGKLLIVNDINLELYLKKVVPSEMPSTWQNEALKAQAVAARTYAYQDILNKSNDAYGYTVDDSVKSQVYNNNSEVASTNRAILETAGMIMTYDGKPIQAYYYSASSGLTASGHEVWIKDAVVEEIPYLIGQNLAKENSGASIVVDTSSEASMLEFFKRIRMNTPDSAPTHRWRVGFSLTQLTNTIRTNLPLTYAATPESVLTQVGDTWVSQDLPLDLGTVTDVYVSQRGTSGVVVSLDVVMTSGTYRIVNQYNIRFTVRPKDAGWGVRRWYATNANDTYTGSASNDSILLSGFFAIERAGTTITFYGGGNGHGVGMSQYGAQGMASTGSTYTQILTTYYSNINLEDIRFAYTPLSQEDYRSIFRQSN